jgi:hypothetical protein
MEDEKMAAGVSALSQSLQNSTKLSVVYCMSSRLLFSLKFLEIGVVWIATGYGECQRHFQALAECRQSPMTYITSEKSQ